MNAFVYLQRTRVFIEYAIFVPRALNLECHTMLVSLLTRDTTAVLRVDARDLSVSRPSSRVSWGIDVPNDSDHTVYVWCALSECILKCTENCVLAVFMHL